MNPIWIMTIAVASVVAAIATFHLERGLRRNDSVAGARHGVWLQATLMAGVPITLAVPVVGHLGSVWATLAALMVLVPWLVWVLLWSDRRYDEVQAAWAAEVISDGSR